MHPRRRVPFVIAAAVWAALISAGCQPVWPQGAAAFALDEQRPPASTPGSATEPAQDASFAEPTDARVGEAQAQVLAFIHRLDRIDEPKESARSWSDAGEPDGRTPAQGGEIPGDAAYEYDNRTGIADGADRRRPRLSDIAETAPAASPEREPSPPRVVRVSVRSDRDWSEPVSRASLSEKRPTDPVRAANVPVSVGPAGGRRDGIDGILAQLSERVAQSPNDILAQWRLALLRLAVGEDAPGSDLPVGVSGDSAALLGSAARVMSSMQSALDDSVTGTDDALIAVDALRWELRVRAELSIPTVALCSRVQAFGLYDELPAGAFTPGVQNQAIVYFVVRNFTSEWSGAKMRTLLSERLEVLTSSGDLMWEHEESMIEDFCAERREDFFIAQRILLPARLPRGEYVLKVTVEDQLAAKRTQAIHPFTIGTGL